MMKSSKPRIITIGIIILTCILIMCVTIFAKDVFRQDEPIVHKYSSHADRYVASDIQKLVDNADYIIMGQFNNFLENWVMRTEPNYKEGEIYSFDIEEQLYGNTPEKIKVVLPHFERLTTEIDSKTYSADIIEPHYSKPDFAKKYILFLKRYEDVYVPSAVPFILEINNNDTVFFKFNKDGAFKKFDISKNESLEITGDALHDFEKYDDITGKTKSEILTSIKESLNKKVASP